LCYPHFFVLFVAFLDFATQMGHADGADWQEEVYQQVLFAMMFSFAQDFEN